MDIFICERFAWLLQVELSLKNARDFVCKRQKKLTNTEEED